MEHGLPPEDLLNVESFGAEVGRSVRDRSRRFSGQETLVCFRFGGGGTHCNLTGGSSPDRDYSQIRRQA